MRRRGHIASRRRYVPLESRTCADWDSRRSPAPLPEESGGNDAPTNIERLHALGLVPGGLSRGRLRGHTWKLKRRVSISSGMTREACHGVQRHLHEVLYVSKCVIRPLTGYHTLVEAQYCKRGVRVVKSLVFGVHVMDLQPSIGIAHRTSKRSLCIADTGSACVLES